MTWLYGPLQDGSDKIWHLPSTSPVNSSRISNSNSFSHKKTILKKRSMSEIMLQRSLSSSSLVKQATVAVKAQQSEHGRIARPGISRRTSVYAYPLSSRRLSGENTSMLSSISPSGLASPETGKQKHIHFNDQVEQCIALEMKGDNDYERDSDAIHDYDGDSIMMKSSSKRKLPALHSKRTTPRQSITAKSKTIAMLPSTTLKYRGDTPESSETAMKHSSGWNQAISLRLSGDFETLEASMMLLLGDDEEDDDLDWKPPTSAFVHRKESVSMTQERFQNIYILRSSSGLTGEPLGMRKTSSGMFIPYERDEDNVVSEGILEKL